MHGITPACNVSPSHTVLPPTPSNTSAEFLVKLGEVAGKVAKAQHVQRMSEQLAQQARMQVVVVVVCGGDGGGGGGWGEDGMCKQGHGSVEYVLRQDALMCG